MQVLARNSTRRATAALLHARPLVRYATSITVDKSGKLIVPNDPVGGAARTRDMRSGGGR